MYDKRWTVESNVLLCLETQGLCSKSLNCIRRFYTSTQYVKYKLSSNNGDYERQKKKTAGEEKSTLIPGSLSLSSATSTTSYWEKMAAVRDLYDATSPSDEAKTKRMV